MIRNLKFTCKIVVMGLFFLLQNTLFLAYEHDPFYNLQYKQVFDQTAIYKKYSTLMRKLGCADNVFGLENDRNPILDSSKKLSDRALHDILNPVFAFDPIKDAKELAAFEKECMDQLNNARRMILITPATKDLSHLAFTALFGGTFYAAKKYALPSIATWFSSQFEDAKASLDKTKAKSQDQSVATQNTSNTPNTDAKASSDKTKAQSQDQSAATQNTPIIINTGERSFSDLLDSGIWAALFSLKGIVGAGYNLMYWPDNSLEDIENHFAKNKCYIPRALWPKIEQEFMDARHDAHNRDLHRYFLNFALGFTVYKPKQKIHFKDNMTSANVKNELNRRIDEFFADYKDSLAINYIKINVSKFVDALMQVDDGHLVAAPRSVYLYGSGGIGKTHFVQTLSDWIKELIPGSVRFEDLIIESPGDLEGSERRPGAMLKALRNQLLENRRGSVIMIDEATWLNYDSMISSAKRLFNGDRSKLTTSYFGSNMDGTAVTLEMPPTLIFVASNELIQDPALASRFDTILYPLPSEQALLEHAIRIANQSSVLKEAGCPIDERLIKQWIGSLEQGQKNFRFIAGNIEAVLLLVYNQIMQEGMTP